jgi:CheY-like chemotaxis protein
MKRLADVIDILLVEDNDGDARLAQEALAEAKVANTLYRVADGEEALEFLRKQGKYASVPRPQLVFLDLNLPKKDGMEVLREIKHHPSLHRIPVVILTASEAESDIVKSYDLHANSYVTKPLNLDQFIKAIKAIEGFWLSVVKFPREEEG